MSSVGKNLDNIYTSDRMMTMHMRTSVTVKLFSPCVDYTLIKLRIPRVVCLGGTALCWLNFPGLPCMHACILLYYYSV